MTERFELLEQIGKGGMGTVWKARDTGTGEVVALKVLHDMYVDDAEYVARFEREVDIARKIDHPNVVKVLGYGKRGGVPYVAMEYVDGPSLKDLIRTRGAQGWEDWGQAKRFALQLTEALRAAHAVGVIHRDVKPSNVLIDPQGNVKLADFGIARAADLTRMTGGYTMMGTPAYMSPEGESSVQSDLYALGCVLYEMLAGGPPFTGDTQQQVLLKHIRETPDLSKLSEGARRIVGWLLEKDPRKRPANAEALIGVLEGSTGDSRPRAAIPGVTGAAAAGGGSNRRKVALFGGVPLVVLLAGAGVAFALAGGSDPTEPTDADATPTPAATSMSVPTATPSPTSDSSATPVHPSLTPLPPTATPQPPVATPVPPTAVAVAPTATPVPPTATSIPPTKTPIPPTATSTPTPTATATRTPTPTSTPTPRPPVPAMPPLFQLGEITTDSFTLHWGIPATDVVDGHFVTDGVSNWTLPRSLQFTASGYAPGTYVCFSVAAFNAGGTSALAPWACGTTSYGP